MFVVFVHPDHDDGVTRTFLAAMKSDGWTLLVTEVCFLAYGDSINNQCAVIIGVHVAAANKVTSLAIPAPPTKKNPPLAQYLWAPFDRHKNAVSVARDDPSFG